MYVQYRRENMYDSLLRDVRGWDVCVRVTTE